MISATTVAVIAIIVGSLASTGALVFFVKYGIRLAVLENMFHVKMKELATSSEKQIELHAKILVMENTVRAIEGVLPDLRRITGMADKIDELWESMKTFVPRPEIEARLNSIQDSIAGNTDRIVKAQKKHAAKQ